MPTGLQPVFVTGVHHVFHLLAPGAELSDLSDLSDASDIFPARTCTRTVWRQTSGRAPRRLLSTSFTPDARSGGSRWERGRTTGFLKASTGCNGEKAGFGPVERFFKGENEL